MSGEGGRRPPALKFAFYSAGPPHDNHCFAHGSGAVHVAIVPYSVESVRPHSTHKQHTPRPRTPHNQYPRSGRVDRTVESFFDNNNIIQNIIISTDVAALSRGRRHHRRRLGVSKKSRTTTTTVTHAKDPYGGDIPS